MKYLKLSNKWVVEVGGGCWGAIVRNWTTSKSYRNPNHSYEKGEWEVQIDPPSNRQIILQLMRAYVYSPSLKKRQQNRSMGSCKKHLMSPPGVDLYERPRQ